MAESPSPMEAAAEALSLANPTSYRYKNEGGYISAGDEPNPQAARDSALVVAAYLDCLLGDLPEEGDCGVCGVPGEYRIKVCEGYDVPRCHAHRLAAPFQAEARLASLLAALRGNNDG